MVSIISLGGSIVAPDGVDTEFISRFIKVINTHIEKDSNDNRKVILIVGGGGPARTYQQAHRNIVSQARHDDQDWIGIMATRLNAELIRACFPGLCENPVITDPTADFNFTGSVLVAAGWKPGFSTDFDAVMLAERFHADRIINLSNIEQVYTADPKLDPEAQPLEKISWSDFRRMVGDEWTPGKNLPFDPVATRKAAEMGIEVIAAGGRNLENTASILEGEPFFGTSIGPE